MGREPIDDGHLDTHYASAAAEATKNSTYKDFGDFLTRNHRAYTLQALADYSQIETPEAFKARTGNEHTPEAVKAQLAHDTNIFWASKSLAVTDPNKPVVAHSRR